MEETRLSIRLFGDPVLRKKTKAVKRVTAVHKEALSQMSQLMYASSGIGLAAPQVGISESLIVVDIGRGLYKLVNPKIIKREDSQILEEGCLSIPGICIKVKRARKVVVKALDEAGKQISIEAEGLLACVFQHEIEHLSGKLIVDYASWLERLKIKHALSGMNKKRKNEGLSKSETKSCELQL